MTDCFVCGHDYAGAFTVTTPEGDAYSFDSFECAIHALAPTCGRCGCRVIGHGVEVDRVVYCCSHCSREAAGADLSDSDDTV